MTTVAAHAPSKTGTNPPCELARYANRVVVGQRIDGVVELRDEPVGRGITWPIEQGLGCKSELDALLTDYLAYAAHIEGNPMADFEL